MQSKLDDKLSKKMVEAIVHSAFTSDYIKEEDLKDQTSFLAKISKIKNFHIIIDYRDQILSATDFFLINKKNSFAIIFFAMYFEHTINQLITKVLQTKNISKKSITELIRHANFEAKFTWVLELLGLPKFNEKHKKIIIEISKERNSFIHYKFLPNPEHNGEFDKLNELIKLAKKSIIYLKKYESQILYKGNKKLLKKILKMSS